MGEQLSDLDKLGPHMMGELWSDQGHSDIKEITISHSPGRIYSFCVVYHGPDGDIIMEHGVKNQRHTHTHIPFALDEVPTRIYGHYKVNTSGYPIQIVSVGIETNRSSYGPYGGGVDEDEFFSWDVGSKRFCGFHGAVIGGTLVGLGVFVKKYISTSQNILSSHPHPEERSGGKRRKRNTPSNTPASMRETHPRKAKGTA